MRTVLAIALLGLAVAAGCTGPAADGTTETTVETPPATETMTTTTAAAAETDSEPRKGDQLLSATGVNETQASQWNASRRADFGNLSAERRAVVREAVDCDCNVALDGEFSFYDEERLAVVAYDGQYYYLRVAIV